MSGLTVTEKEHWKNRIARRIDKRIEAITAGELARRGEAFRAGVLAWLQSAQAAEPPKLGKTTAEVTLELPLRPLWRWIVHHVLSGS